MLFRQPLNIFHWFPIALQHICECLRGDFYWALHQLGDVIAAQELTVIVGVGLWKFKGLAPLTVLIHVGKERTGVGAIVASTAEYQPVSIA